MSKQKTISTQEKFLLNLDETDLTTTFKVQKFEFTVGAPSLFEEARITIDTISIAKKMLQTEQYSEFVKDVKIPKLTFSTDETTGQVNTVIEEEPVDLDKINHVAQLLDNILPTTFRNLVQNIAFLNILVKDISVEGKPLYLVVDGKEIHVDSFEKFVLNVRTRGLYLQTLVEELLTKSLDWMENFEISPIEVKNS